MQTTTQKWMVFTFKSKSGPALSVGEFPLFPMTRGADDDLNSGDNAWASANRNHFPPNFRELVGSLPPESCWPRGWWPLLCSKSNCPPGSEFKSLASDNDKLLSNHCWILGVEGFRFRGEQVRELLEDFKSFSVKDEDDAVDEVSRESEVGQSENEGKLSRDGPVKGRGERSLQSQSVTHVKLEL